MQNSEIKIYKTEDGKQIELFKNNDGSTSAKIAQVRKEGKRSVRKIDINLVVSGQY